MSEGGVTIDPTLLLVWVIQRDFGPTGTNISYDEESSVKKGIPGDGKLIRLGMMCSTTTEGKEHIERTQHRKGIFAFQKALGLRGSLIVW
jgi:hypothetical protein